MSPTLSVKSNFRTFYLAKWIVTAEEGEKV